VLVQQQQLGLFQGRHQQGDCLALAAGKQTDLAGHAVLQAQAQGFKQLVVLGIFLFGNTNAQGAARTAAGGQGQVFINLHRGGGAHHGVLEHTANVSGALVLRQAGDILTINNNLAHIHRPHTGNSIQHGGLARTVAADYGDEIAVLQCQVQIIQGNLLVDRTGVKSLVNVFDLKHCCCRLSLPQRG